MFAVETDTRYENGDSLFSTVLSVENSIDMVWLFVAPPVSHVFLALHNVQFQGRFQQDTSLYFLCVVVFSLTVF